MCDSCTLYWAYVVSLALSTSKISNDVIHLGTEQRKEKQREKGAEVKAVELVESSALQDWTCVANQPKK